MNHVLLSARGQAGYTCQPFIFGGWTVILLNLCEKFTEVLSSTLYIIKLITDGKSETIQVSSWN